MKKLLRILSIIGITLLALIVAGVASFFILIVAGVSPKLQTIWICSAMKTMHHKYLATMFFSDDYINFVLEENAVDDTDYDSHILSFKNETDEDSSKDTANNGEASEMIGISEEEVKYDYTLEGYTMLEEDVYLKEVSGITWRGYIMLVSDPLRVKLVDTSSQYSCGETVMMMVEGSGAIAGINGGGFQDGVNYDSNGGTPSGLIIENGNLVYPYSDDGTVYNMIGINDEGALILRHCTATWALENNIVSAVSFAPFLVVNGEGLVKQGSGGWGIAPRTAIGQRETGEFLLLVIDGRQVDWSIGCDLDVLQQVMLEEDAYNAAMLDGGSSTVMVYNGEFVNKPSLGFERYINNCFVVTVKED